MKLAFSTTCCPDWNLTTVFAKAKEHGYDGVELGGLHGHAHLPVASQASHQAEDVARLASDAGVEIVSLKTGVTLCPPEATEAARNREELRGNIRLAARLGCPFIRVQTGSLPKTRVFGRLRRDTVLARMAQTLREAAPFAAEHRVTIMVENGGDFPDSQSLWYLMDAADSPAVRCCWDPLSARLANDPPTRSIPRLSAALGLVSICDAVFSESGSVNRYMLPGQGQVGLRTIVQLLKGIGFRGYLVFDWPKQADPSLAGPDDALPAAAQCLRQVLDEKPVQLSAFKGDKFRPRQGHEFAAQH